MPKSGNTDPFNEKRDAHLARLAGYKSVKTKPTQRLLDHLERILSSYPDRKERMDTAPRDSSKAKAVLPVLKKIDELITCLDALPQDVQRDLLYLRHEMSVALRMERRSFKRFGLRYPPVPPDRDERGRSIPFLNRITHPLIKTGRDPFTMTKRYLLISKAAVTKLHKRYTSKPSRHGQTKRAEREIEEELFELFDRYNRWGPPTVEESGIDNSYINRKAKFVFLAMKSANLPTLGLGTNKRGTKYNGKLGRAAFAHSMNRDHQLTASFLRNEE